MGKGGQNVLAEYVVKLGAEMDNNGLNQLLSTLDMSKLKAMGLTAALGALTAGVYKFISSITEQQFKMESLAKEKKKSIQDTWAEQQALKAMGVTMNEIKKDKALKEMYDDLVKFNKEMEMPNADRAYAKVRELQSAFYKLKSAVSYAIQAIGAQVLTNLEAPLTRITGKLGSVADWFKNNLTNVASKIGSLITAFAKGIIGIVEGVEKIAQFFSRLPEAIKAVGVAIGALALLINSGPLGKLLTLITFIGDVIHDSDVYQWNKANLNAEEGKKVYVTPDGKYTYDSGNGQNEVFQQRVAYGGLWDIFFDDTKTLDEKIGGIATDIFTNLTETLSKSFRDFDMGDIFEGSGDNPGIIRKAIMWFNENSDLMKEFGESLIGWISRGVAQVGGIVGGAAGKIIDAIFGGGTMDEDIYKGDGSAAASFAGFLGGFIKYFSDELQQKDSTVMSALKAGMKGATIGSLIVAIVSNITDGQIQWDKIKGDLGSVVDSVLGIVTRAVSQVGDFGGKIVGAIADGLLGAGENGFTGSSIIDGLLGTLGSTLKGWSENQAVMDTIVSGSAAALMGGSVMDIIVAALGGAFVGARKEAMQKALINAGRYKEGTDFSEISDETIESAYEGLEDKYKENYWKDVFSGMVSVGEDMVTGLWEVLLEGARAAKDLGGQLFQLFLGTVVDLIVPENGGTYDGMAENMFGKAIGTSIGTAIAGGNFFTSLISGISAIILDAEEKAEGDETVWDVIKKDAEEFYNKILDIWYGPWEGEGDDKQRNASKGLRHVIMPILTQIWEGEDGDGGIKGFFTRIAGKIGEWLAPVASAIKRWFHALWIEIYNLLPDWFKIALDIEDPRETEITTGEDGKKKLVSTGGGEKEISELEAAIYENELDRIVVNKDGKIEYKNDEFTDDMTWQEKIAWALGGHRLSDVMFDPMLNEDQAEIAKNLIYASMLGANIVPQVAIPALREKYPGMTDEEAALAYFSENGWSSEEQQQAGLHKWEEYKNRFYPGMSDDEAMAAYYRYLKSGKVQSMAPFDTENYLEGMPEGYVPITDKNGKFIAAVQPDEHGYFGKSSVIKKDKQGYYVANNGSTELNEVLGELVSSGDYQLSTWDAVKEQADEAASAAEELTGASKATTRNFTDVSHAAGALAGVMLEKADQISNSGGGDSTKEAWGGRIEHELNNVTVGEDGTEYIIPITKPDRAISLINQMLTEMGSSAIQRIFSGLGLGERGTVGASMASLDTALQGMVMNNNYNISAPVNINVNSTGADAREIGSNVYDMAERHLIKSLTGVYA